MPRDLVDIHNDGEKDYAEHKGCHEPHDIVEMASDHLPGHQQQMREENKAYYEGYKNAREQAEKNK